MALFIMIINIMTIAIIMTIMSRGGQRVVSVSTTPRTDRVFFSAKHFFSC